MIYSCRLYITCVCFVRYNCIRNVICYAPCYSAPALNGIYYVLLHLYLPVFEHRKASRLEVFNIQIWKDPIRVHGMSGMPFYMKKTILMCKSQHFNPIGITCSKPIPTYKWYTFWSVRAILHLYALVTSIHNHAAIMYVGTSKGTSTYWFYDFPENRRSPVYDAIQESHPRKRLVQSFLYTLILYKTPIQTYRKTRQYSLTPNVICSW